MTAIQPVILAGGSGSRLWPLSREEYPKQFLRLHNNQSLLQNTIERILEIPGALAPIVVVGESHAFAALNQINTMQLKQSCLLIVEPVNCNTAPAVCAAAFYCAERLDPETVLLVLPADHIIWNKTAFYEAVREALALAHAGGLVTFGVCPGAPETGFGYIKKGADNTVLSFVEKPSYQDAKRFVKSGDYFWNSGMFAFTIGTAIAELEKLLPAVCGAIAQSVALGRMAGPFFHLERKSMASCPDISIDHGLMEKSDRVAVVPVDLGWSDIGTWENLWRISDKDENGNVVRGDTILEDVQNSLVISEHGLTVAAGLRDVLVVETADALLVAPLNRSQDVKKIVKRLTKQKRREGLRHRTVYRQWGKYTILEEQAGFMIRRVTVMPGGKLSLHRHRHRAEHWVVVKGTATVTRGDRTFLLLENQSAFITKGEKHRLENQGSIALEIIEVQSGGGLDEKGGIHCNGD